MTVILRVRDTLTPHVTADLGGVWVCYSCNVVLRSGDDGHCPNNVLREYPWHADRWWVK